MCQQKSLSSSIVDQQQANEPHSQPQRKEVQRPNQSHRARRKYSKEFIKLGFTCMLINDEPCPQCIVCSEVLANESLKAGKFQ